MRAPKAFVFLIFSPRSSTVRHKLIKSTGYLPSQITPLRHDYTSPSLMSLRLPSRLHHLSSYTAHAQVSPTSLVINNSSRSTTDQGQKLAVNHVCYLICLYCFLL
ncbi:hypothetical protein DFP73DRAFT_354935 [Morchella snyderi]|nr:hypothetical protein DFP73DRAFT_354935 [Morchella snyderi]